MARHRMLKETVRTTGSRIAVFTFDRQDVLDLAEHARTARHHAGAPGVAFALETHAALISSGRSRPRVGRRWPAERIAYAYENDDLDLIARAKERHARGDFAETFSAAQAIDVAVAALATVGVALYDDEWGTAALEPDPKP